MKPEKTEQGRLIETFCCAPFQANLIAEDFMETRSMGTGRGDVLAKHMIQSFCPMKSHLMKQWKLAENL